jgi:hypothetical protein
MLRTNGRLLLLLAVGGTQAAAWAATVKACVKNSNGSLRIVASAAACGASETFLEWNKNGPYGDGSAGAQTFIGFAQPADNAQYTDVTIAAGATLFVEPGTVIRCTGTFTNHGRILVRDNPNWGDVRATVAGDLYPSFILPLAGLSRAIPFVGALGDATNNREGGFGGRGYQAGIPRNDSLLPQAGGGGGAGRLAGGAGGAGGGHLAILAQGGIINTGSIEANGNQFVFGTGGGGGGGGVVLLASPGAISNSGTLEAKGGAGGAADPNGAQGGGGGGGLVRLVGASITNTGTIDVSGGPAGPTASAGTITAPYRQGGGGGGACFGAGGRGGDALTDGASTAGLPGQAGQVIQTIADPTSLF